MKIRGRGLSGRQAKQGVPPASLLKMIKLLTARLIEICEFVTGAKLFTIQLTLYCLKYKNKYLVIFFAVFW